LAAEKTVVLIVFFVLRSNRLVVVAAEMLKKKVMSSKSKMPWKRTTTMMQKENHHHHHHKRRDQLPAPVFNSEWPQKSVKTIKHSKNSTKWNRCSTSSIRTTFLITLLASGDACSTVQTWSSVAANSAFLTWSRKNYSNHRVMNSNA
jgi:hypothetical protein